MTELKPCPFCGPGDLAIAHRVLSSIWFIFCRPCDAQGPAAGTEEIARELWNQRKEPTP